MEFDEILIRLGQFGKYQRIQYTLACIASLLTGANMLVTVYSHYVPDSRCRLPTNVWSNDTWSVETNSTLSRLVDLYIPRTSDDKYDKCHIYNITELEPSDVHHSANFTQGPEVSCSSWVYDHSQIEESFISQCNLVCDDAYWVPLLKVLFMAGTLVGAPIFGWISDAIGRQKALLIGIFLCWSTGLGAAFINHPVGMGVLKFLTGASTSALFPCAFVLGIELVGPDRRVDAGIIIEYAFAVGVCIVAGVAAIIRQGSWTQFAVSLPFGLLFSYWWLMPESPRWLISKKRHDEAMNILRRASAVNKVTLPVNCLDLNEEKNKQRGNFIDVFRSKVLLIRSINIFYQWLVCSMVYYGLSLSTGNLPGNIYLNGFLSGLVDFPGFAIGHFTINRFGRKLFYFISMLLAGIFCSSNILLIYLAPGVNWAFIAVGMVGKMFMASAFGIVYVWTSELFPTSVRSAGVGTSTFFARVGSLLGPPMSDLGIQIGGKIGAALVPLTFGSASIIAAVLCIFIPETLGTQLPETIEDGEKFGRKPQVSHGKVERNGSIGERKSNHAEFPIEMYDNGAFTQL